MSLTSLEKDQLKSLARRTIESILFGKDKGELPLSETLQEKNGAFVTIKHKGQLRGCIGYIKAMLPLHETISEMALQAAFHDPRFSPLGKDEWKDVDIEISVLTPLKKIEDVNEIEVGLHGLYIEKGSRSGLLLPQVASEYHWDSITFLENTCNKAGLPKDAWKSETANIYVFSADIF